MTEEQSKLVYSTDGGSVEDRRKRPRSEAPAAAAIPNDGVLRLMRDRRGRGGKTATAVHGLAGTDADLDRELKRLKQLCGAGGTREARVLYIQGDQRDRIKADLESRGQKVKLAGG